MKAGRRCLTDNEDTDKHLLSPQETNGEEVARDTQSHTSDGRTYHTSERTQINPTPLIVNLSLQLPPVSTKFKFITLA